MMNPVKPQIRPLIQPATTHVPSPPLPTTRRQIGDRFELKAQAYLESLGYKIIDRNRIYPWGELDIVAEMGRVLVFIEVRGTEDGAWISPEESLTFKKQMRLKRAIQTYLLYYRGPATDVRLDLIAVTGDQLKHYPGYMNL